MQKSEFGHRLADGTLSRRRLSRLLAAAGLAAVAVPLARRPVRAEEQAIYFTWSVYDDPGFFPDNSGFVFQGTSVGAGFCSYSLLLRSPDKITFNETECAGVSGIELYQHMGASLGGGDYFVVNSEFESDDGGHSATSGDPSATFGKDAQVKLTPMIFDGSHYVIIAAQHKAGVWRYVEP